MKYPVSQPDLGGNEERYVTDAVRSTWISSSGIYLERFEREFAELCETEHAMAISNGTTALHVALLALDVGPGDEVIVPSLTYISPVNAVRYVGATPVFVDVDPATWCLDIDAVEAAITETTRAVIVVHLYGQIADVDRLRAVCDPRGIRIVEDAAEALLGSYHGRPTGGLGDIGTFSFYGNKILTSGEGGAVTVHDDELARRIRMFRGQGMQPDRRYWFPIVGYNYRLTNVAAAFLCAQLERREHFVAARNEVFAQYEARLAGVEGLTLQRSFEGITRSPWLFCVLVDEDAFGCDRDTLAEHLAAAGIETRPFFPPIHRLPPYEEEARARGTVLPVTDALAAQGINLPTYVGLGADDIEQICDEVVRASTLNRS